MRCPPPSCGDHRRSPRRAERRARRRPRDEPRTRPTTRRAWWCARCTYAATSPSRGPGNRTPTVAERSATVETGPRDLAERVRPRLRFDLVGQRTDRRDVGGRESIEDVETVRHGRRGYRSSTLPVIALVYGADVHVDTNGGTHGDGRRTSPECRRGSISVRPTSRRPPTFYSALFGWECPEGPEEAGGYRVCHIGGTPVAGIGPAQNPGPPMWSCYVNVESADAASAAVTANGGQVFVPPMDVLTAGRMARVRRPGRRRLQRLAGR